jgi:hypothetical protein
MDENNFDVGHYSGGEVMEKVQTTLRILMQEVVHAGLQQRFEQS